MQYDRICPICESNINFNIQTGTRDEIIVRCDCCGKYAISAEFYEDYIESNSKDIRKSEIASYLYYHKSGRTTPYICEDSADVPSGGRCVTIAEIENWYPKKFSDKVDMFLIDLANRMNFMGEPVLFSTETLYSACFVDRYPQGPMRTHPDAIKAQAQYFEKHLAEQGYTVTVKNGLIIQPKGLERIDALQKNNAANTKNVFVAMAFAPDMKDVREAIKNALIACGYNPRVMDEIEHNHQIVLEMLYEIREARFVVAELTGHNNGAYFEAGYALGHGKEVIQVCQKEKFGEDGHFDVKQVNTILWDTTEDLTSKLIARIKATIT